MRTIGALIVIILGAIPALLASFPALEPAVFAERQWGVPVGVLVMCAVMLAFILLGGLCSAAARDSGSKTVEGH